MDFENTITPVLDDVCEPPDKDVSFFTTVWSPYRGDEKPLLAEHHVFGVTYDVILIILAWTLALSFVVKSLKEVATSLRSRGRCSWFCSLVLEYQYVVPGILGASTALLIKDTVAGLLGYSYFDVASAIMVGICAGSMSMTVNMIFHSLLGKYLKNAGTSEGPES